jgi:hypothetical protein
MALVDLNQLCKNIMASTYCVWTQRVGDRAEPVESAWRRIFGNPMNDDPVMLIHYFKHEGRDLVAHLRPLGRVYVVDAAQGHQIRRLKPALQAAVINANKEREQWNTNEAPMVAATNRWLEASRHMSSNGAPPLHV